ncbi:MAG TPA: hypothetical protein VFV98_13310 [Vicinamibacterales bacterium]|nr:hypothetical protein [Vicinamibacterales bacterium]
MLEVAKLIGAPGSLRLLGVVVGVLVLLWLVRPRWRRRLVVMSFAVAGLYLMLALPMVANAIAGQLPYVAPVPDSALAEVDRLVVFDGDNRRGRARTAIALVQAHHPREVHVLGMGWMVEALDVGGVPRHDIRHDVRPANTLEQVRALAALESSNPGVRTVVIVSRLQAPRTRALLDATGSPALVIGAPIDVEPPTHGAMTLVPRYIALRVSRDAIYELVALRYYRWKGWIR